MAVTIAAVTGAAPFENSGPGGVVTSDGRRWVANRSSGDNWIELWYSADGVTWTEHTASRIGGGRGALLTTDGSSLYMAYSPGGTTGVTVRRGTVSGTTITWTSLDVIAAAPGVPYPVALNVHREGSGQKIHVIANAGVLLQHYTVTVDAAGALTASGSLASFDLVDTFGGAVLLLHHVGDEVTVKGGLPHLFLVRLEGTAVYYVKGSYSAGSWTWGTRRTLGTGATSGGSVDAVFDGSRVVAAWKAGSAVGAGERDAGDTSTTTHTVPALSDGTVDTVAVSYDSLGDILVGAVGGTSDDVSMVRYDRDGGPAWGSWSVAETATAENLRSFHGYANAEFGLVWWDATANLKFDVALSLNLAPYAPPWVTVSGGQDVASSLTIDWTFSDPDEQYGDTQSAYALKRVQSGVTRWWNGTDWSSTVETYVTSSTSAATLLTGWATHTDAAWALTVRTKDAAGVAGPYSEVLTVTPSAKINPTLVVQADQETVTRTVEWTVSEQSAYRARLLLAGALVEDSGWVESTSLREHEFAARLTNLATYTEEITTKNAEGLASVADDQTFAVAFVEPLAAGITLTENTEHVLVELVNEDPTAIDIPDAVSNHLYRRVVGTTGSGIRVAVVDPNGSHPDYTVASEVDYEYMVVTDGDNGTSVSTEWVSAGSIGPEPEPEPDPAESSGLILLAR